jgi:hypothetical protein
MGAWPTADEVAAGEEVWFRILASQPGAGVFVGDDPIRGAWASEAARLRYDLARHGTRARRCPIDFVAFDPQRPRGQTATYCSTSCRNLASRDGRDGRHGWRKTAQWIRCPAPGCSVGHLDAAAGTSRPHPSCPPLPDALGHRPGPSPCERAYARILARARMARHRAARRADHELDRAAQALIDDLAGWRWTPGASAGLRLPADATRTT